MLYKIHRKKRQQFKLWILAFFVQIKDILLNLI
jgi:hypothetical protein